MDTVTTIPHQNQLIRSNTAIKEEVIVLEQMEQSTIILVKFK